MLRKEVKDKVLVIKTEQVGMAPYYAEFYHGCYDYIGGIQARNNCWHEAPKRVKKYDKRSYSQVYLTEKEFQLLLLNNNYDVEII